MTIFARAWYYFFPKKCKTLAELIAYIKPGDIAELQYWVKWRIQYKPDVNPSDEWEDINVVLARNPPTSDCEEKSVILRSVIRKWPEWSAFLMVVHGLKDGKNIDHAVCVIETPEATRGYIDDSGVHLFSDKNWRDIARTIVPNLYRAVWVNEKGKVIGRIDV